MNICMTCTLWTPFQAERDWKNSYREILLIPLYIFYSLWIYQTNLQNIPDKYSEYTRQTFRLYQTRENFRIYQTNLNPTNFHVRIYQTNMDQTKNSGYARQIETRENFRINQKNLNQTNLHVRFINIRGKKQY